MHLPEYAWFGVGMQSCISAHAHTLAALSEAFLLASSPFSDLFNLICGIQPSVSFPRAVLVTFRALAQQRAFAWVRS